MSMITAIADAIVTDLNGAAAGTFAQTFTAARHYRPQFDLAGLKTLRVSVVPKGIAITGLMRSANQHEVSVDVAVQRKVDAANMQQLDALMTLVEQIAEAMRGKRLVLAEGQSAAWVKTENDPIYAPEHLQQKQVFTSVLTFTFRVVK